MNNPIHIFSTTEKFKIKTIFFIGRANKGLKQTIGTWAKKTGLEYNRNLVNGNTNQVQ